MKFVSYGVFISHVISLSLIAIDVKKEVLPHECGIAAVYCRKPLSYYAEKYGDIAWGLHQTYLLLEKQRNRGQDGAGICSIKKNMPLGDPFIHRIRSIVHNPLEDVFTQINRQFSLLNKTSEYSETVLKEKIPLLGEIYIGHVRYGTYGSHGISYVQPFVRKHFFREKNFAIAGNFNMTNTNDLKDQLLLEGINADFTSDTNIIMTSLAYHLDQLQSEPSGQHLVKLIKETAIGWDGGYVFAAAFGDGQLIVWRDPAGIRPGFMYENDEVIAFASERAALSNVFMCDPVEIVPLKPGYAVIINRNGIIHEEPFTHQLPLRQCTFERIYFSRGNDHDIYQERKLLGKHLASRVFQALDHSLENTIFTYIPNTSEIAFLGLIEEINALHTQSCFEHLRRKIDDHSITYEDLTAALQMSSAHTEKIAHKDQLLRTFITQDNSRNNLVASIYDVTRGIVNEKTRLVVIDDSIVRGTTLRESIIKQLSSLHPKEIIIVSSAPPILYPDCYGIDMSQIGKLIGFQAAIALAQEKGKDELIDTAARICQTSQAAENNLQQLFALCTQEELEHKIAQLVTPKVSDWQGKITIIYQTIDGLHKSMPNYTGDWYFTGNYPTSGGFKVLNKSFLQWYEGRSEGRAY